MKKLLNSPQENTVRGENNRQYIYYMLMKINASLFNMMSISISLQIYAILP